MTGGANTGHFYNSFGMGSFKFINHNKTDFENYQKFQKEIENQATRVEKTLSRENRINALRNWDASLTNRWRGASLKTINQPAAKEAIEMLKKDPKGSFYIQGESGSGKTFIGYGIIRRLIGAGKILPHQIKIITEEMLLHYATSGFKGREKLDELLSSKYKLYFIDGVGMRNVYTDKELDFIEKVIEHVHSNTLIAIFTGNDTAVNFSYRLSSVSVSKFKDLVDGRIITAHNQNERKTDWGKTLNSNNDGGILDAFSD